MTKEQAKAKLILLYGMSDPTEQEIAMFSLYGENAPFIKAREQTQVAIITISGGKPMKDLEAILLHLRGTQQLLSLFCSATKEIKADIDGNPQEVLFNIEEALKAGIKDLERVVYSK